MSEYAKLAQKIAERHIALFRRAAKAEAESSRLARELEEARAERDRERERGDLLQSAQPWGEVQRAEGRAKAAESRLSAALAVLREVEWSQKQTALRNGGTIYTATLCPACGGEKDPPDDKGPRRRRGDPLPPAGHKPGCRLASLLASSSPLPAPAHRCDATCPGEDHATLPGAKG